MKKYFLLFIFIISLSFTGCFNIDNKSIVGIWKSRPNYNNTTYKVINFLKNGDCIIKIRNNNIITKIKKCRWTKINNNLIQLTIISGIKKEVTNFTFDNNIAFSLNNILYFNENATSNEIAEYQTKYILNLMKGGN